MTQHHEDALCEKQRREVGTEAAEHILGPNPVVGVYVLAGTTDHITPWQACYHSSQLLGGQREFIQSILNPKATFFTDVGQPADAQDWFAGATRRAGSWWEHWKAWLFARSGSQKGAPSSNGNNTYIPLVEAPGTYAYE